MPKTTNMKQTKYTEPLFIDTTLEYAIDRSRFPGIDNGEPIYVVGSFLYQLSMHPDSHKHHRPSCWSRTLHPDWHSSRSSYSHRTDPTKKRIEHVLLRIIARLSFTTESTRRYRPRRHQRLPQWPRLSEPGFPPQHPGCSFRLLVIFIGLPSKCSPWRPVISQFLQPAWSRLSIGWLLNNLWRRLVYHWNENQKTATLHGLRRFAQTTEDLL